VAQRLITNGAAPDLRHPALRSLPEERRRGRARRTQPRARSRTP